jgi:hypothetical protein
MGEMSAMELLQYVRTRNVFLDADGPGWPTSPQYRLLERPVTRMIAAHHYALLVLLRNPAIACEYEARHRALHAEPDELIALWYAAPMVGMSPHALRRIARRRPEDGRLLLRTEVEHLPGCDRTFFTTRRWLHEYLMARDEAEKQEWPLPEGYVAPETKPGPLVYLVGARRRLSNGR